MDEFYWFKPNRYVPFVPLRWEGYVTYLVIFSLVVFSFFYFEVLNFSFGNFFFFFNLACLYFGIVCYSFKECI